MSLVPRAVVLMMVPRCYYHEEEEIYAARFEPLGVTSYGNSMDEALTKVEVMLEEKVLAHHRHGSLEGWLNESGVEWEWEHEPVVQSIVESTPSSFPSWRPMIQSEAKVALA